MERKYNIIRTNSDITHHGIKGMKWGVRRYRNADGSLTPAGKKRNIINDYKSIGASKKIQRQHGYETLRESKLVDKTSKALERLETNNNDSKYTNKQRAKDYDIAIRGMNTLKGNAVTRSYYDRDQITSNENKIKKIENKNPSKKTQAKIKQLTMDNELMELSIMEAAEKYEKYNDTVTQLINRMSQDKTVVYTTRHRIQSMTGDDIGYQLSGTDYKVRANTKSRSKSKKYNDPKRKKQYDTELSKYITVYY